MNLMNLMTRLLLAVSLTTAAYGATIFTPGTYSWEATFGGGQWASGIIVWDNTSYTMATTSISGPYGFGGAITDPTYSHRLTLVFTREPHLVSLRRLTSLVPPGLGYLPYGHLYGGEWPPDVPRFLGDCPPEWNHLPPPPTPKGCVVCPGDPILPPIEPPPSGGPEVPEPATYLLVGATLVGLALQRKQKCVS